tara:strand:- start:42193 stop:43098 length:906 start_codon:yes stop_codon:yes gene_type:complete
LRNRERNKEAPKVITNAMSVDVEDYFQVSAFENILPKDIWNSLPVRVEHNTYHILKIFEKHNIKATFFILGWVAERYPNLVREIVAQKHEVASHGFWHQRVHTLTPHAFKQDVDSSKKLLEDISGLEVKGYRAPSYSINYRNQWALSVLEELGFVYSSSVYPIKHDIYGWPTAPRFKFTSTPGGLIEIPISTLKIGTRNVPCGGGGYFRLFPYRLSRWAIQQVNQKDQQPCIFYFHPWEIDPNQPKQKNINFKTRFRHYHNLSGMQFKLEKLLHDFKWGTIDDVFLESKASTTRIKTGTTN